MNKKKILITGGAGFIGSKLAKYLIGKKYNVFILDNLSSGKKKNIPKNCHFFFLDCINISKLKIKFDIIYHLAGQSSGERSFYYPELDYKDNVETTRSVIKYAKKFNIKKIVFTSSMSVYGDHNKIKVRETDFKKLTPISNYGLNKLTSESYLSFSKRINNINFTILRLFNVYGPGQDLKNLEQGMLSIYFSFFLKNKPLIIKGKLSRVRDFIFIDDVVRILFLSKNKQFDNKIINIGTGIKTSVEKVIKILQFHFKKKKIVLKKATPGDIRGVYADVRLLKKLYKNFKPISLQSGIKKMVDFYEN